MRQVRTSGLHGRRFTVLDALATRVEVQIDVAWAARSAHQTLIVHDDRSFLSELDMSALATDKLLATFRCVALPPLGECSTSSWLTLV